MMKIEKHVIPVGPDDFSIGKMSRWNDFVFLFDPIRPALIQLSASYEVLQHRALPEAKTIDSVCFGKDFLVAADSRGRRLHHWQVTVGAGDKVMLTEHTTYPLPVHSTIAAMAAGENQLLLLDKEACMIRVLDGDFKEIKTVGSRMGYIYDDMEQRRLGFEFPEDMLTVGDRVLVSDSGNKRLVVIDTAGGEWKQEQVIPLPEYPYKFIFWDGGDRVTVSDFDRSVMTVSLAFGFVCREALNAAVDFFPSFSTGGRCITGSENTAEHEIVALETPETPLETLAAEAGNKLVLMRLMLRENRVDEARAIALADESLLPEYAKYTSADTAVAEPLATYVQKTVGADFEMNETLRTDVYALSVQFIKVYKYIPECDDTEAAHIDKENIRHRMFLKLKDYRSRLRRMVYLADAVREYPETAERLKRMLDERFQAVKQGIAAAIDNIEGNLQQFNEAALLEAVVSYWLFGEEESSLFRPAGFRYEKLFGDTFLLAILNDFYYHTAELFLKRGKVDQYISFADREITMYPDKMGMFKQFINRLLQLKKSDDVVRMLEKFPDKNKENVNYFYYRVYLLKNDRDRAFYHLKRELDLFPHRNDLIPPLLRLNRMNREEAEVYIDKILEKSGRSIDACLNVAKAFQGIGDNEEAEVYVDKELHHFPENQNAVASKLGLLLTRGDKDELRRLVTGLTTQRFALLRSKVYYVLGDFENSWTYFKNFMVENSVETTAVMNTFLFESLDRLRPDETEIAGLWEMAGRVKLKAYKDELLVYLSFLKYFLGRDMGAGVGEIDKYPDETYLSAYSTGVRAHDYFFERVKQLNEEQQWDELLALVEKILKYNPGDKDIFGFLDRL